MKRKLVVIGVAAAAVAAGGGAYAATGFGTPQQESKAVIEDAAGQLGIDPTKLSNALKKALEDRVDAAVAAGTITKAEGDALKARIESQDYPLIMGGFGRHGGFGLGLHGAGLLSAAATYQGLSETDLQSQLAGGKTLADVAKAQGKTVDGLVSALLAAEQKKLDAAVASGRLTQTQADEILANAKQRITDMVNGSLPHRGWRGGFRPGSFDGPPPSSPSTAAYAGPSI